MPGWCIRQAGGIFGRLGDAGRTQVPRTITFDLNRHDLKNRPIKPGELAYGLILFPREAGPPQPPASAVARPGYRPVFSLPLPI
jgi:hypothetical protein